MNENEQLFDDILQKMFLKTKILYIKWHSPGGYAGGRIQKNKEILPDIS